MFVTADVHERLAALKKPNSDPPAPFFTDSQVFGIIGRVPALMGRACCNMMTGKRGEARVRRDAESSGEDPEAAVAAWRTALEAKRVKQTGMENRQSEEQPRKTKRPYNNFLRDITAGVLSAGVARPVQGVSSPIPGPSASGIPQPGRGAPRTHADVADLGTGDDSDTEFDFIGPSAPRAKQVVLDKSNY